MSNESRIIQAALHLTEVWDGYALADNACHMTQTEMLAFANLYAACGSGQDALDLMECWVEAEIEDRECEPGDFRIEFIEGWPHLIDTRPERLFPIGTLVDALYPNQHWGMGIVISHEESPKMKPIVVQRDDGEIGWFNVHDLIVVIDVPAKADQ